MDLRGELQQIFDSRTLPDGETLLGALDFAVDLLQKEDSSFRPEEDCDEGFSGGLIDFSSSPELPLVVIPDIHARGQFFLDVLDSKIAVKDGAEKATVLEALEKGLAYAVSLGDLFHSEGRAAQRWNTAYEKFRADDFSSEEMTEEMLENINLLRMVLKVKCACPKFFHVLKGNHENILNEEGNGNHPFYKIASEGEMMYWFLKDVYDDALIYLWSCFEHSLPVCAVFHSAVLSHAEPRRALLKDEIINCRKNPGVILDLTWTGNGFAEEDSVSKTIKNLTGRKSGFVWISGHRPVKEMFGVRQKGLLFQIHNPSLENAAVIYPGRKFNPEKDIVSVGK